jgi:two-component system cell cycle sensor histidine kinase/response regulator CckA
MEISERKRAEKQLRETNQNLQALIQACPLAILTLDSRGHIAEWNPAAERIFGWKKEEILGQPLPYVPPEKRDEYDTLLRQGFQGRELSGFETYRLRKDGTRVDLQLFTAPLHDPAGNQILGTLVLAQDITQQNRLEEQFRQAQKMEAIGSLAGGVAHDFNNLLTIINGYSELILTHLPADSPVRELVREIGEAGERAASLTRQLLAFSRKQVLEPKVLNLNAIVTDTAKMLRRLIGEDIGLNTVLEPGLGQVKADPGQIEQVLINLAVNARDAMPPGGNLTMETANVELDGTYTRGRSEVRPGPYVRLTLTDTGCGMDEATQARIFEPFFTTKGPGKGTGLGLATVYGIIKQSDGHIAVYSEVGCGTTFKVYLPLVQERSSTGKPQPGLPVARHGTETILLVEDEPALRVLARHILRRQGYTVLEASRGEKALQLGEAYEGTIHLLVTDVVMPGMSGRQLAESLTARRPNVKILYLSGYTDDAVVRHGVLQAEKAFLQKPFTPHALAQKVRDVLDR